MAASGGEVPMSVGNKRAPKLRAGAQRAKSAGRSKPSKKSSHKSATQALTKMRAEARAAMAQAERVRERLREAIDILPHGLVFLDADGRYILWNKKYADIYKRSADLFKPGAKLADTLRIGVARGYYPEAIGREEEWIRERVAKLFNPSKAHEQYLSDGRCIMIEERRTSDGDTIGLRVDITDLNKREESFRLLFQNNPVAMYLSDIYTLTGSLAGIPCMSVPCGLTSEGLPVGLQILCDHFKEPEMFRLAHAFESAVAPQTSN